MGKVSLGLALAVAAAAAAACNGSNSSTTAPTTNTSYVTETLTGVVPAPINGVLQSASNNFTVGQGGGTITVILTSAIETLRDGTLYPTVVMGLAIGTPSGSTCTLSGTNPPQFNSAGPTFGLTGSANAGTYCVQVSDATNQLGPVNYTVVVQHP